jgi:predicted phage terminase large subunit-like protein
VTAVAEVRRTVEHELQIREDREVMTGNYREFVRGAWHVIEPHTRFKPSWHIDAVCEALMAVSAGEIRNLQIWVPPGSMKSILANILFHPWEWATNPWLRFITGSYADDLSEDFSGKARDVIQSDWFQERWPIEMRPDLNTKGDFANMEGGRRMTTSPSGGVTGRHADRIIIDDPLKPMEIASDAAIQKVNKWYDGTLATRAADATTVAEIIIMQRLHENDLAAHVLNYADWEIVCLPERYDPKHPFVWPKDQRTEPGQLLWPARVGERENKVRQLKLGQHQAAGQLQQMPSAREGDLLKRRDWRYFDGKQLDRNPGEMAFTRVITSWDTAFKDKTSSDYVVGQVWGQRGADRFFLRSVREQMAFGATMRAIKEFDAWIRATWPYVPVVHVIEKSANGTEIIEELKREITGIKPWVASTDKRLRAEAAQPTLESHNCHLPGRANASGEDYHPAQTPAWVQAFVEECSQFDRGANDDQVDAWSQAMNYLNSVTYATGGFYVPEGEI